MSDDGKMIAEIVAAGGLAFPANHTLPSGGTLVMPGMTLRDYFAAQGLTGLLSACHDKSPDWLTDLDGAAMAAYAIADAMLEERRK